MTQWAPLVLDSQTWWPSALLVPPPSWPGSPNARLVRVGEIATVRAVASRLSVPLPLVSPRDVDAASGQLRPRQLVDDSDALVLGDDLQVGDVLVPAYGGGPCVLISDDARGLAFRNFIVVRAASELVAPTWLWALLSSRSGASARESRMSGTASSKLTASALADLPVPLPALADIDGAAMLVPRPLVAESVGEELRSVWSIRDLRRADAWVWQSSEGVDGISVRDLGVLRAGRIDPKDCFGAPGPGRLPVLTPRMVRGHDEPSRRWANGEDATNDATVIFTRTEPFRVAHAPTGMLLPRDLLALEVRNAAGLDSSARSDGSGARSVGQLAASVASYFASPEGKQELARVAVGAVLRHLSLRALGDVRVHPGRIFAEPAQQSSVVEPLPDRLEGLIGERPAQ